MPNNEGSEYDGKDNECFSCPLLFQDTICNLSKDTADNIGSFLKTSEKNSRARRKSDIFPVLVLHEKERTLAKAANGNLVFERNVRNSSGGADVTQHSP